MKRLKVWKKKQVSRLRLFRRRYHDFVAYLRSRYYRWRLDRERASLHANELRIQKLEPLAFVNIEDIRPGMSPEVRRLAAKRIRYIVDGMA